MSRHLGPPSTQAGSSATEAPTTSEMPILTETQTLPALTPPVFHAASRQLPLRIQLPPLTIPSGQNHQDYKHFGPRNIRPGRHEASTAHLLPADGRDYARTPVSSLFSPRLFDSLTPDPNYPSHSPHFRRRPESATSTLRSGNETYGHDGQQRKTLSPLYATATDGRQPFPFHRLNNSAFERLRPEINLPQPYSYGSLPPPPLPPPRQQLPSMSTFSAPETHEIALAGVTSRQGTPIMPPPPPLIPRSHRQHHPTTETQLHQHVSHRVEELHYELRVRQQPIAARACGFGERDRRVIDPPPIIQLAVSDVHTRQVDLDELRYSLNVVHCTLWSADGRHEETALMQPDRRATRRLMGQLVASPSVAKDEYDQEGCFFCFPDLSCRTHGRYRLRFVLMRIDPANLVVGGTSPILTAVLSDVFTVYTAKDFPGMRPSSALTRALKLQGCNIQVKKGNEKMFPRKRAAAIMGETDIEDGRAKRLNN